MTARVRTLFRGVVQDESGRKLAGLFRVYQGDLAKFTRKFDGAFSVELDPGSYRIDVQVEGHQTQSFKTQVRGAGGMTHYFHMHPIRRATPTEEPPPATPAKDPA